ncbi:MAG: DsbA family protein [Gammaproteobacteria bacterium]|nr:DsbA family protein [Gammaproteobacteria bacterium]
MVAPRQNGGARLFYAHDPMCSWCWGFQNAYQQLQRELPSSIALTPLLGGLAPDSDAPMPQQMRQQLQATWRRIEAAVPGARFNHDFWRECIPRRSTWPACRAVLAARAQDQNGAGLDAAMTAAIQRGYYLQARNPSDEATLVEFAAELGLNAAAFKTALRSDAVQRQLESEIAAARQLGVRGFPALVLLPEGGGTARPIRVNYADARAMLDDIARASA